MPDSEELVVFMTLERGVEEMLIPGVLVSRGIRSVRSTPGASTVVRRD
jgi:hypothetical protein